ncbi:hypothetical protein niasHT_008597 [Heterodera trifolii]|uniref:Uncharacterized protein n=1 Tax=Heterodera trifolii TaxID=157864 RepID=A0ABD2M437_9BILA
MALDLELDQELDQALDQGLDLGLDQGLEQALDQGLDQALDQALDLELDQELDQALDQGLDLGLDRVPTPPQTCTDEATVFANENNGCDLITCPVGRTCGILIGIARLGTGPFEPFLYPKCVSNPLELTRNTEQNGNEQILTNGPGCNCGTTQCAAGFQCQVRSSIVKLGNRPFAQIIGGFPQCVGNYSTYQNPFTIVPYGPGLDLSQFLHPFDKLMM